MNNHNSIIVKLVNLAETKGFVTLSDIDDVLHPEFNIEELDDLVSSILEIGIQIQDNESPIKSKVKPVNNDQDIRSQNLLSQQTLEMNKSENEKNILINKNIYLVNNIANEHMGSRPYTMGLNDLVQEGYLGLLTAATDYKPNGEESFSIFASKMISDFIEKAIENEKRLGHQYNDMSLEFLNVEQEYIRYWKEEEEVIYTTKFNDQSKPSGRDHSELTLTSISKIQLPHIPNFDKVNPSLTSDDVSLLVEKKNISNDKKPRKNRSEHMKAMVLEDLSVQSYDCPVTANESLPKVYSKVRFDNDRRLSLYAKVVGERAEKIVIKYLTDTLIPRERESIRWISKSGETPGWDIEYCGSDNNIVAIEVKGTNGKNFPNIEITGNEWNAAIELRDHFWIYLVSDCLGTSPKIQRLQNPFKLKEAGLLRTTPILWRIEMISSDVVL